MVVGVAEQVSVTPVPPGTTPWQAHQGHVLVEPRLNPNGVHVALTTHEVLNLQNFQPLVLCTSRVRT